MTWTDPRTWVVGEKLRAADLNEQLRDNLKFLYEQPMVSLRRTSDLGVDDATTVSVPWSEAVHDPEGMWDSGSPEKVVIQREGLYIVHTNLLWDSNTSGMRQAILLRNGVVLRSDRRTATDATEQPISFFTSIPQGDEIEIAARQSSGSTRTLVSSMSPTRAPVLMIVWIAPLI